MVKLLSNPISPCLVHRMPHRHILLSHKLHRRLRLSHLSVACAIVSSAGVRIVKGKVARSFVRIIAKIAVVRFAEDETAKGRMLLVVMDGNYLLVFCLPSCFVFRYQLLSMIY